MQRPRLSLGAVLVSGLMLVAQAGNAVPIFLEDFESDLSQWTGQAMGPHTGVIVADPIRPANQVLSFSALQAGGDVFSVVAVDSPTGSFQVSFEYLGLPGQGGTPDDLGGFVGLSVDFPGNHRWLAGTNLGYAPLDLVDDGQWHSVTIQYDSLIGTSLHVMLEDFLASGGVAGDVFFDDVVVEATPEPGTAILLAAGLLAVASLPRTRPRG